ncbi:DUF861 domain-containing protein [Microbacterium lacticum]|uniref:cupin domain-containing protein n=1 Tax=Microbacterium lacticum TaxID=33885 RepID=UPI0018B024A8|nr:cupin domain-containing protein [Microbacterium lacticum]MBF9336470.1 DUF861 domain-containing protein [Microbacterium lacticum]
MTRSKSFDAARLDAREMRERLLQLPEGEALNGELLVRSETLYRAADGAVAGGIWEAEQGLARFEFLEYGELVYLIEGHIVAMSDEGEETILSPGVCASFPRGWVGVWDITVRSRKFAVSFR